MKADFGKNKKKRIILMVKQTGIHANLTQKDVDLLLQNPDADVRCQTAQKVSAQYQETINENEKKIAEDIFRLIANDVEIQVRQELAENLKKCPSLPRDIVQKIVSDVAVVAGPMIQFSKLLTEQDLIEIIKTNDEEKQMAVARRENVPFRVSETLIEEAAERPVVSLISNEKADISDYAYQRLMERFKDCENIHRPLLMRSHIPVRIFEKLINVISDTLKKQLLMRRDLPEPLVTAIVSQTREKAILSLSEASTEDEVRTLVIHLNGVNRLTPNLILRAACVGDMKFFEYALAMRASVPIRNARVLIYDSGQMGLERLYEEADLPSAMYPAICLAVKTYREMMGETEDGYRDHFCRRLLERLLISFDENDIHLDETDMNYFMQRIGKNENDSFDVAV